MARLVSWPVGLRANAREPLSGPRSVGGASTQSVGNFQQVSASPFALWRWRFSFPPIRGQMFRRYRGWITSLQAGANATRVTFCDWDGLTPGDAGVQGKTWDPGLPWDNSMPWDNGQPWHGARPIVAVTEDAAIDATIIKLASDWWGHRLDIGDWLGFAPLHLGLYTVTEVVDEGVYRIWPPLRKAITTDDFGTLEPVMAMRLESEDAANAARGAAFAENLSITLVETLDYDVRDYFAD